MMMLSALMTGFYDWGSSPVLARSRSLVHVVGLTRFHVLGAYNRFGPFGGDGDLVPCDSLDVNGASKKFDSFRLRVADPICDSFCGDVTIMLSDSLLRNVGIYSFSDASTCARYMTRSRSFDALA